MRTHFTIFLAVVATCSFAQSTLRWYQGSLVLADEQVLVGEIIMEMKHDVILFRDTAALVKVLHASKVRSVRFYDNDIYVNRKFTVIQQSYGKRNQSRIFELVAAGEVSVIRRLNDFAVDESVSAFNYFVFADGEVLPFNKFRKEVYPKMTANLPRLEVHAKKNKLDPNVPQDIIRIVSFYNCKVREDIFASAD